MATARERKIYYKRFTRTRNWHFSPASGFNTPRIPLGGVNTKGVDYEIVRVQKTEGKCSSLRGRRVLISWGLNLPREKWSEVNQVIAVEVGSESSVAEILLAC